MAKISVVIPVYKVPFDYLNQCIHSVINQSLKDIEIIIVDDGSPKEWGDYCDSMAVKDERIKVIHKKNGGVSDSRNVGLKASTSEWITFIDGDDWIDLDFLESFITFIHNSKEQSNTDFFIYSGYRNYIDKERICKPHFPIYTKFTTYSERENLQTLCFTNYSWKNGNTEGLLISSACAKIYKRNFLINNNLFFKLTPYAEDCLFFLDTVEKSKSIIYIDKPVYHYRVNLNSAVNKYRPNAIIEHNTYLNYIFKFAEENKKSYSFKEKTYYRVFISMCNLIKQNFFNKDNPDTFIKKWRIANNTFKQEPYKTTLKKINPKLITKNSLIKYYLFKLKLYPLIELGRRSNYKMNIKKI